MIAGLCAQADHRNRNRLKERRELSVGVRNSEVVPLRYPVMPVTNRLGG